MQKITLPQNIIFAKGEQLNEKKVIIEPCYPGYGVTIGNSLRRVLLSSLPGAAVIGVKIKGVTHEFTTIPFVKEDVLEILLNFKKLRLKVYSDEVIKLNLSVNGEKVVKAGDITKNSQVEIINPDLILASITDIKGSLDMEIYAAKGVGYETIESRENKNNEIGYIEI
ncbi:DNA-directed RNA polymerase subunit alpha, partial [Candidatus Falkowbacteria bacterium CG_4_8_14_3_um_filter_36_11]